MRLYEAACECGWKGLRRTTMRRAQSDLRRHPSHPPPLDLDRLLKCASCSLWYPLLVDDGPLCLRCDLLHDPGPFALRRVA